MFNFKKSLEENWDFFFDYGIEMLKKSKFVGLPLGKSGYGFIGLLNDKIMVDYANRILQDGVISKPILISESVDKFRSINSNEIIQNFITIGEKIWPDDLILRFSPQEDEKYSFLNEIQSISGIDEVNIMIPKHPILQKFFLKIQENFPNSTVFGIYALINDDQTCFESEPALESIDSENLGVMFNYGSLQKKSKSKPVTIIQLSFTEDSPTGQIEIIQQGLISIDVLKEKAKDIRITFIDDTSEEEDEFGF